MLSWFNSRVPRLVTVFFEASGGRKLSLILSILRLLSMKSGFLLEVAYAEWLGPCVLLLFDKLKLSWVLRLVSLVD